MKWHWLLIALTLIFPTGASGLQAGTPQAALEEVATADNPEDIARHLPDEIRKTIEELPRPAQQSVMEKLLEIKSSQINGCSLRRSASGDWEILDSDGKSQGKVRLENPFIAGVDAMLPVHIDASDRSQSFIVTMHLEGHDWRIDGFGSWQKTAFELQKLVHQPTQIEVNDDAARDTLLKIESALNSYASTYPQNGYPRTLASLAVRAPDPQEQGDSPGILLDESFAAEPLVINGYEFHYLLTEPGDGNDNPGSYKITANPIEFRETGSRHYLMDDSSGIHCTTENRPATEEDTCGGSVEQLRPRHHTVVY